MSAQKRTSQEVLFCAGGETWSQITNDFVRASHSKIISVRDPGSLLLAKRSQHIPPFKSPRKPNDWLSPSAKILALLKFVPRGRLGHKSLMILFVLRTPKS